MPVHANLERDNTEDWIDAGDLYVESGDLEEARDAYKQGFHRWSVRNVKQGRKMCAEAR